MSQSEKKQTIGLVLSVIAVTGLLIFAAYYFTQNNRTARLASDVEKESDAKQQSTSSENAANKASKNVAKNEKKASIDAKSSPKTATLRLPEKTNNLWKMKPVELPDTKGQKRTLNEWKGKVIMLNFWASWCAPCQFEIPRFVRYQNKYADNNLQIVGIGLDDVQKLKNVERSLDMNYPTMVISQSDGQALLDRFGNDQQIVPYTIVIDKDGTIVYIHRGGLEDEDFNEYVLPLLKSS